MGTPTADIPHLLAVLAREQETLLALKDVIDQEREAIRDLAKDRLATINAARQQHLHDLALHEQDRAGTVLKLGASWGLDAADLTVGALLGRATPQEALSLREYQRRLGAAIQDIKEGLGFNRRMVTRFLGLLQQGFSAWTHTVPHVAGYSASGAFSPMTTGGDLIERKG